MNSFVETLVKIEPAIWIAIVSLLVSIAALIISNRRLSFDMRLVGAKKATELRSLFLEYRRKTGEFLEVVDAWEKVCRECELYPEHSFTHYRKSADSFRKFAYECIQALKFPVTKETAILLEPITAHGDDLCKQLSAVTECCRKAAEGCQAKKKSLSEQGAAPDAQEAAPR